MVCIVSLHLTETSKQSFKLAESYDLFDLSGLTRMDAGIKVRNLVSFEKNLQGGDIAQLAECWTGMLPRQVGFHSAAGDFSLGQLSVQIVLQCPYTPV